jgi:hypothetical protein
MVKMERRRYLVRLPDSLFQWYQGSEYAIRSENVITSPLQYILTGYFEI